MLQSSSVLNSRSFPLSMANEGEQLRIVMHKGGMGLDRRLTSLGLHIDTKVEILQRLGGSLVVAANDIRFALGSGMAQKIMVVSAE